MTFNDAEGNPCSEQSVLVYSKNIRDTFEQVVKGRGEGHQKSQTQLLLKE